MPVTVCVCGGAAPWMARSSCLQDSQQSVCLRCLCMLFLVNPYPWHPRPAPCTIVVIIVILFLFLLTLIINNININIMIIIIIIIIITSSSINTLQPAIFSRKICCSTPSPLLQPLSAWSHGQTPLIHEHLRAPFHPSPPESSTPTYSAAATTAATAAAVGRGSLGVGASTVEGAGAGGAGGAGLAQGGGGNLPLVMTEEEYQRLMSSWQPSLGLAATTSSTMRHGSSQNDSLLNGSSQIASSQIASLAGQDGRTQLEVAAPLAQSVVLSESVCDCVCLCV